MYGSAWGTKTITGVLAAGDATQLFPVGCPAASMVDTTLQYPPVAPGGDVRRAIQGSIHKINIASDQINGGYVELWDVAGKDRGALAAGNVNNGDLLTDAYLTANGTLIDVLNILGPGSESVSFSPECVHVPFNKGLALRYVGGGTIKASPWIIGGFSRQLVVG